LAANQVQWNLDLSISQCSFSRIVRHLWSRIKFNINNVIYFCIHYSPNLWFFCLYRLKITFSTQHFPHGFSCMVRLRKNWSELFMWDPCCAPAPRVADCMYVQSTLFICVILPTLPTWPSVSSHPYLRFQHDYGSTKETCENFARPIENNTCSREESWRETCGHCRTDADRENILSLEKSYFQLRQNSAKKQKTMYDFLVKNVVFRINCFPIFIVCFLHSIENDRSRFHCFWVLCWGYHVFLIKY
jgi:hypothetical protein